MDYQAMLEDEYAVSKGQKVLAANIDRAIRESGVRPQEIADACDLSVQAVSNWRKTGKITKENLLVLAKKVNWTVEELQTPGGKTEKPGNNIVDNVDPEIVDLPTPRLAPVVGTASLGADGYWYELEFPTGHGDGDIACYTADANVYALRVKGDSMHPRIKDGEYVIVSPNSAYIPSNDVLVQTNDGRSMVKELAWQREGQIKLLSVNERHPPIVLNLADIKIIHRVLGYAPREALVRRKASLGWDT